MLKSRLCVCVCDGYHSIPSFHVVALLNKGRYSLRYALPTFHSSLSRFFLLCCFFLPLLSFDLLWPIHAHRLRSDRSPNHLLRPLLPISADPHLDIVETHTAKHSPWHYRRTTPVKSLPRHLPLRSAPRLSADFTRDC